MAATIQDVADEARVSTATVSKVLNHRYDVAPETAELVENAIHRLGYQRGATRRGRPTTSSYAPSQSERWKQPSALSSSGMAMLIPDHKIGAVQSTLTGQLFHGAEAVAREQGMHFHLTRFSDDGVLPPCLNPVQVDGLIVRNTRADWAVSLPPIPTVWVFKLGYAPVPGDLVQPDNEMIGLIAANYILERGHKNVASLIGRLEHSEAQVRADRFVRFCRAAGANATTLEGADMGQLVQQLLSITPRVTGLFLPLGDSALEAFYHEVQRHKVTCGSSGADIDLIPCTNDATYLRLLDPTLPNIDIQADEIGRTAARTLLWRIQHPQDHRHCILVEPRLVKPEPR